MASSEQAERKQKEREDRLRVIQEELERSIRRDFLKAAIRQFDEQLNRLEEANKNHKFRLTEFQETIERLNAELEAAERQHLEDEILVMEIQNKLQAESDESLRLQEEVIEACGSVNEVANN